MSESIDKRNYSRLQGIMWQIGNSLFNFADFAKRHPGGEEYILQSKGTDATLMFYTHHSIKTLERIERQGKDHRFWVCNCDTSDFLELIRGDEIYWDMKREVDAVLRANGGPGPRRHIFFFLYFFYFAYAFTMALCGLAFTKEAYLVSSLFIAVSGICGTIIAGFGHNFIHQRIRPYNWLVLDSVGFPSKSWRRDHCLKHHMYTNNSDLDPEITDWAKVGMYFDTSRTSDGWLTVTHPLLMALGYWLYSHYSALLKRKNTNEALWMSFVLPIALLFTCTGSLWWSFVLFECIKLITVAWFINIAGLPHVHVDNHANNGWDGQSHWSEIQIDNNTSYLPDASLLTKFLFAGLNEHLAHHLFPYVDMSKYDLVKEVVKRHCEAKQGDFGNMITQRFELLRAGAGG